MFYELSMRVLRVFYACSMYVLCTCACTSYALLILMTYLRISYALSLGFYALSMRFFKMHEHVHRTCIDNSATHINFTQHA